MMNIHDLASDLAGRAKDAIGTVGGTIEHGGGARAETGDASVSSMEKMLRGASRALRVAATVASAYASIRTVASVVGAVRPARTVLGVFGLRRRPGMLMRLATNASVFTMGAAVGAGVALLLAPRSGAQTRERMGQQYKAFRREAEGLTHDVETAANDVVESVEETLKSAKDRHPGGRAASSKTEDAAANRSRQRPSGISHRSPHCR